MLCPEDLIVTKVLAGRRKDLEDVRGVLRECADTLQVESIRSLLQGAEEALERPGLVRRFERLWKARGAPSRE